MRVFSVPIFGSKSNSRELEFDNVPFSTLFVKIKLKAYDKCTVYIRKSKLTLNVHFYSLQNQSWRKGDENASTTA